MHSHNEPKKHGTRDEGNGDMFCRTVVAAVAAMLALRLCQYLRKLLGE